MQKSQSYVSRYDIFQLDATAAISYDNLKIYLSYLALFTLHFFLFFFFTQLKLLFPSKIVSSCQFFFLIRPNNCYCLKENYFFFRSANMKVLSSILLKK